MVSVLASVAFLVSPVNCVTAGKDEVQVIGFQRPPFIVQKQTIRNTETVLGFAAVRPYSVDVLSSLCFLLR